MNFGIVLHTDVQFVSTYLDSVMIPRPHICERIAG